MAHVKFGSNNRLALLSYIILQIRTTKGGCIKLRDLLIGELLSKVFCIFSFKKKFHYLMLPKSEPGRQNGIHLHAGQWVWVCEWTLQENMGEMNTFQV